MLKLIAAIFTFTRLTFIDKILGPIISAGASLIGGEMGKKESERNRQAGFDLQALNAEQQKEFAQHGIRWRVEDAKAAGLHPLFALTGNTQSPTPTSINFDNANHMGRAISEAGQNLGRAIGAQETADQKALRVAQLKAIEASTARDLAHSQYYLSEIARRDQQPAFPDTVTNAYGGAVTYPVTGAGAIESHPLYADAVKLKPDEMASRDVHRDGQTAGRDHPGMRQFVFPGGFRALLPASEGSGIPDEIDASMIPLVIGANLERYGARWLINAMGYFTGRSPDSRRGNTVESTVRELQDYFGSPRYQELKREMKDNHFLRYRHRAPR